MYDNLVGINNEISKIVNLEDTAKSYGSGSLEVLATPCVILEMEKAAHKLLDEKLDKEYTTVGIYIEAKHLKATKVGKEIKTIANINKVEGKKIFFEINTFEEDIKVATCNHTRYVVKIDEFMK